MNSAEAWADDGPILVTGASGFVGGQVLRALRATGYRVRGLSRRPPEAGSFDEEVEWFQGDLCDPAAMAAAVRGVRGVVHSAGWVSLTADRAGESRRVNVEATARLLDLCETAGVERFVYTSTLWTVGAGTRANPADESSAWNLPTVRSAYCESKRAAERLVLERNGTRLQTFAICPGFVVGPGDRRPTSTGLLLTMARYPFSILARGGIPFVDARVLGRAHRRALEVGEGGTRYVVAGDYLSYPEVARIVEELTGWPRVVVTMPDWSEGILCWGADLLARVVGDRLGEISGASIAGGFLRLHVSGERADRTFGLEHPPVAWSIHDALQDHAATGRARWLRGRLKRPAAWSELSTSAGRW